MALQGLFVGIATLDLGFLVTSYPTEDTKTKAEDSFMAAGGPATNAAATFSFLAGGGAKLMTALGSHPLSDTIRDDLAHHAVRVADLIPEHSEAPPLSAATISRGSGSRTIVSLDASRIPAFSTELPHDLLAGLDVVLVDGHLMDLCIAVASAAKAADVPVVFDGGRWKSGNEQLLGYVDIAICSRSFVPPGTEGEDPLKVHEYLLDAGVRMAATTDGPASITYTTGTEKGEVVVPRTQVLDTLGAGDVFHGAFCYYYSKHQDGFAESLSSAAAIASLSCRYFGTREWMGHADVQLLNRVG